MLGPTVEQTYFDTDIITHINSALSRLHELGVGPTEGFYIEDDLSTWGEFIPVDSVKFQRAKTFVYLKTKLVFDPPASATILQAMKEEIKEIEWLLEVAAGSNKSNGEK